MTEILKTITVQEAAALWPDPKRAHLKKWEAEFNQPLEGLHAGHVITYQTERIREVDASVVITEVDALCALLKQAGTGEEIKKYYNPLEEGVKLAPEELDALPRRARMYIYELEQRLKSMSSENALMENKIRTHNWGRKR